MLHLRTDADALHQQSQNPSASELEELKKQEERHNRMMETLSADAQDAIKKYYESFIDKIADDNTFYYRKGCKGRATLVENTQKTLI